LKHTRASFDEQKIANCILLDGGVLVVEEDITPLLGNTDEAFKSSVPSVDRFVLFSVIYQKENPCVVFFLKMTNFLYPIFHLVLE
jgi:hypothetical protein